MSTLQDYLAAYKNIILVLSTLAITTTSLLLLALLRLAQVLPAPASSNIKRPRRPPASPTNPTHLLVVLGSGGHTAEMINILASFPDLADHFSHRTYLVSSGDSFSAGKAVEFERQHASPQRRHSDPSESSYSVVTVRRARRVHQPFLTTPLTALLSLWDCIAVLRGTHADFAHSKVAKQSLYIYPDLILTNGPGTGVCVVLASLLLRFFGFAGHSTAPSGSRDDEAFSDQGQMRTVFIESWARVKTLSLSGKILRPLVNRFLVQWPQLVQTLGEGVEYIGPLVS